MPRTAAAAAAARRSLLGRLRDACGLLCICICRHYKRAKDANCPAAKQNARSLPRMALSSTPRHFLSPAPNSVPHVVQAGRCWQKMDKQAEQTYLQAQRGGQASSATGIRQSSSKAKRLGASERPQGAPF